MSTPTTVKFQIEESEIKTAPILASEESDIPDVVIKPGEVPMLPDPPN